MKTFRLVFNLLFLCGVVTTICNAAKIVIIRIDIARLLERGNVFSWLLNIGVMLVILGPFLVAEVETWYDLHYLIFAKKRTVGQIIFNIFMLLSALAYMAVWIIFIFNNRLFNNYYVIALLIPILYMFAARYFYFAISKARDNVKAKSNSTISEEIDL